MAAPPGGGRLQHALQLLVQSIHWTYSLFWQLCPQQGVLVWGEGYYNGAIKTRKTVQPMEMSADDASLQRSQQLRELYDSLSAGEAGQTARRPCAALSPEDLTESEWFYLMCVSFSFPPGVGLPGKAFTRRRYVWLTRANEAESKVFSRAILAKSARIQTVVCIPLADGVLELGTTEKIEEDVAIIQHAKIFFADHYPNPALSEHSTSNPEDQPIFNSYPLSSLMQQPVITQPHESNQEEEEEDDDDDDEEDENEENDDNDDEVVETGPGLNVDTRCYNAGISVPLIHASMNTSEAVAPAAEPTELMQLEMSESIRFGSPDDCSNNLDSDLQMLAAGNTSSVQSDHHQNNSYQAWNFLHENLYDGVSQSSGATQMQELFQEDAHYSETVATILQYNLSRCTNSIRYPIHSQQSAFSKWDSDKPLSVWSEGDSQWMLKCILFTVPDLYFKDRDESSPKERDSEGGSKFRKGTPQEELSANHVLAERRRREKLNERFIILRSLVPFVTKMDKASILGDTIEYVKQLRKRIQDLESQNRQIESEWQQKSKQSHNPSNSEEQTVQTNSCSNSGRRGLSLVDKKKIRVVEDGNGTDKATKAVVAPCTSVQVSIIESDALLELECPYRDGLLLKIMHKLHELLLEITSIQSSSANGTFVAEIRAKVKEVHGRKTSIVEVKKAIYQIFSQNSL